jgi:hypothetical protein
MAVALFTQLMKWLIWLSLFWISPKLMARDSQATQNGHACIHLPMKLWMDEETHSSREIQGRIEQRASSSLWPPTSLSAQP